MLKYLKALWYARRNQRALREAERVIASLRKTCNYALDMEISSYYEAKDAQAENKSLKRQVEQLAGHLLSFQRLMANFADPREVLAVMAQESGPYRYYVFGGGPSIAELPTIREVRGVTFGVRYTVGLDARTPPELVARHMAEEFYGAVLKQWMEQSVMLPRGN